jgi:hypothetical protein
MADLRIDLAAEFKGKKAFKEADQAVTGLDRAVGKLGKQIAGVFAAQKLYAFGKASVKAFTQDEVAANRLATAVDNLGLSLSQTRVADFISNLEKTSGILDDTLRPAFQALLTTTGSLAKSQELLNNAIQISRASGIDLATVSQDLANGYIGITKGLKKYNTGLTQAELKSKSFNEVLGVMLAKSAGAADAYLTTTSYKLDILNVAAANAQETIGKGLVDAFARIAGGKDAKDAAVAIDNIAKAVSKLIVALGTAIGAVEKFRKAYTNFLAGGNVDELLAGKPASTNRSSSPAGTYARTKQQREAEAAAAKRAKELAALQAKQVKASKALTAEQKKQASLKKAGTVFDLEQIQLVAALKGKLSEEEKLRVKAQLALLNENATVAKELTDQILAAQDSTGNLAKFLTSLPDARNPFQYLDAYLSYLAGKAASIITGQAAPNAPSGTATPAPMPSTNVSAVEPMISYNVMTGLSYNPNANQPVINVTVQGSVIKEQELIAQIQNGTQLASLSGSPSQIGRIAGMFG